MVHDGWNVVQELNAATANASKTNYKANVINGLALDERYQRQVAPNSGNMSQPNNPANPSTTQPLLTSLLTDALGSTLMVTKADQTIQTSYSYEPYGKTVQTTPAGQTPSDNPYQYTGREHEAASASGNRTTAPQAGLYYYRNRFYGAGLQRFVSEDPIDFAGGANLYAYVSGDPVSRIDPDGKVSILIGTAVAIVSGYFLYRSFEAQLQCERGCELGYGEAVRACEASDGMSQSERQDLLDLTKQSRVDACKARCAAANIIGKLLPKWRP